MDMRRAVFMVVLLGGLVWAVMTSPLTKRFLGGAASPRPVAPGALSAEVAQPSVAQVSTSVTSSPVTRLSKDQLTQWRQLYETAWHRDPFFTAAEERTLASPKVVLAPSKPEAPPGPLPSYAVKTILISEAGKVATLDGRLVSEGESIGEERVVEIRPDSVVLERGGQRRRINLLGGGTPITETSSRANAVRAQ